MKIALYYPWIHLTSGVERTILETVKNSEHQFTIFTNHLDLKNTYPELSSFKIVELTMIPVRRNIIDVLKASIIIAKQKINLYGFDLLLVHSEGIGDLILLRNNSIPAICFCHTPLRPVFDEVYKKEAIKKRSNIKKMIYNIFAFLYKKIDQYLWKRYKLIIFNSKETLNRAIRGGLISKSTRYEILHPGVHINNRIKVNYNKYFLCIGRVTWTKNIELAISSFKLFKRLKPKLNFKLVIAGQVDKKSKEYFHKIFELKNDNIVFNLNPNEDETHKLYKNCYTVLCTALNEDWGITPIEANSYSKPTICVKSGGFKESQIDSITGYLVKPKSEEFAKKMTIMAENKDLVLKLGRNAFKNSKKYDWGKFVAKFDECIIKNV